MIRRAALGITFILLALPAWAAEGTEAGFLGVPTLVWKVANFLLFFGVLYLLLARPAREFFQSRRDQIGARLTEAERAQREAEQLRQQMAARVAALAAEVEALRERLHADGEREREALERQGEAEAARLLAQIEQEAARRVADARRALAADAAAVAAELAEELLRRGLTAEDRSRIFAQTLARLGEAETRSAS